MTTPQLPLALRCPPDQRLDSYVDAPTGAVALLGALAAGSDARAVYVEGAAGSGKTHLALATCAAAQAQGQRVRYLPLRAFAGHVAAVLPTVDADVVALDDVDAVAGTRADEIAVFDFHNAAMTRGVRVLYTASAPPDAVGLALPDLRSRLGQCVRIPLRMLDDAGRRRVLEDRARRRGLQLDTAALEWLLVHHDRDMASLTLLLDRLDRASLAAQRRVTLPFLKQVLQQESSPA